MNRAQSKGSTMTPVQNNSVVMKTTSPQPGMPMLKLEAVYMAPGVTHTILEIMCQISNFKPDGLACILPCDLRRW